MSSHLKHDRLIIVLYLLPTDYNIFTSYYFVISFPSNLRDAAKAVFRQDLNTVYHSL